MEPESTNIMTWLIENWKMILDIVAYACLTASAIVKATPTLKDDNIVLPIIKFIGRWIAFDKYGPTDRPKEA